ncbi:hypothetical protein B5F39_06550 [Cloacibacillus sp. An23]|nr:hypothetical protein B5F39_06550 [Cloacibacillus sp. An23]
MITPRVGTADTAAKSFDKFKKIKRAYDYALFLFAVIRASVYVLRQRTRFRLHLRGAARSGACLTAPCAGSYNTLRFEIYALFHARRRFL